MYSLLMMTAIAAGPDTASFGGRLFGGGGCCGGYVSCYGCCGYSYGCCGYSYGCCGGYNYGCCGGWGHGHKWHNYSYGCCGYSYGCCGYSYGCCGGYVPSYGCCGGAYGGCYGSWYGSMYGAYSPGGCFGYGVITGGPTVVTPGVVVGGTTIVGSAADTNPVIPPATTTVERPATAPARLTIELPANAKLIVDGRATRGEGVTRQFHTPPLPAGQAFYYEMRAEMELNGKVEVEEKRVVVRAGQSLNESFAKLTAVAAESKATSVVSAK
jgi:uncharacterized protein (TIGR03000 family)